MKKRKSFTALALGLLLSCYGNAASALSFEDMPQNWAKLPLERAVQNKILVGHKGRIMPYDNITRAQFSSILSRLLHYSAGKSPKFSDVSSANWYYEPASKLVSRNILELDKGNFYPSREMTREEIFTAIAKALQMHSASTASIEKFADYSQTAETARPYLDALVERGYLSGYANRLHPKNKITRAELAAFLDKLFPSHLTQSGEYTSLPKGNVLIRAKNIVLKDLTIEGHLIFAEGFSPEDVKLVNTLVKGETLLLAGIEIADEATPLGPVNPNLIAQNRPSSPADRVVEVDDDRDSGGGGGGGGNTPSPNTPSPNTPSPNTPSPNTPSPNTPSPNTPSPNTPSPNTPSPNTPSPNTPSPNTPSPNTPSPNTPSPNTPSPNTPSPNTPSPNTPSPNTPSPNTPSPNTPSPNTPSPNTPSPNTPSPNTPDPSDPNPGTPTPQPPAAEKSLIETDVNIKNTKIADLGYVSYLVIHFTKADFSNYEVFVDGQPITLSKVNDGGKIAKWEIRALNHRELKIVRTSDGKIGIYDLIAKTIVK